MILMKAVRCIYCGDEKIFPGEAYPKTYVCDDCERKAREAQLIVATPPPVAALFGRKFLITTDDWFYAPDGQTYKAAWGRVEICKSEDLLGVKPHNYANWFAVVDDILLIAGCQIHYAVGCENRPAGTAVYVRGGEGNG